MSLIVSTAFHASGIQWRAFVVMGVLATSDADDDLQYQILVAFKTGLASLQESDSGGLVSMLRCMCRVVPGTPRNPRYLPQVVWLAVALLQLGDQALFAEAAKLLEASLETLDKQDYFRDISLIEALYDARAPLDDVSREIDAFLNLSFDTNFSFTLASIIFRGMRHPPTYNASASLLRTLLRLTTRPDQPIVDTVQHTKPVPFHALGYFIALLPTATSAPTYRALLLESGAGSGWWPETGGSREEEDSVPKVTFQLLGATDSATGILVATFLGQMLNSAVAEPEREMLFSLIAEISTTYPHIISVMCVLSHCFTHLITLADGLPPDTRAYRIASWKPLATLPIRVSFTQLASFSEPRCSSRTSVDHPMLERTDPSQPSTPSWMECRKVPEWLNSRHSTTSKCVAFSTRINFLLAPST